MRSGGGRRGICSLRLRRIRDFRRWRICIASHRGEFAALQAAVNEGLMNRPGVLSYRTTAISNLRGLWPQFSAMRSDANSPRWSHRKFPAAQTLQILQGGYFLASRYFSQSLLNWSIPFAVRGWSNIILRTLNGTVAKCAPAFADSKT